MVGESIRRTYGPSLISAYSFRRVKAKTIKKVVMTIAYFEYLNVILYIPLW
jgi:hypothetical protein